nr:outer membrane beta-barrel protein [uncultured Pedobacter sp.]
MNAQRIILLLVFICTLSSQELTAQIKRTIKGSVKDSTNQGIPGSYIRVITGKDTLTVIADKEGDFSISNITAQSSDLLVRSIGYKPYASIVTFLDKQKQVDLGNIVLKTESNMLDEVVIKGKITPIRVMKDTIEYNTEAFVIREGDYVEDLLKQFPGMVVKDDGKVTSMGKELTRLRVNGKDFFTSNVAEFIKKLPSSIFSHVQVIDDYGDEANFTGIKVGEPRKILNLVTKPGRDKGTFANVSTSAATSNSYALNGNANVWKGRKQMSGGGSFNNTSNDAQVNNSANGAVSFSDNIDKKLYLRSGYNMGNGTYGGTNFNNIQSANSLGTINSVNEDKFNSGNGNHNLNLGLNSEETGKFFAGNLDAGVSNNNSENTSSSLQTGVIRQDLFTSSTSKQNSPNVNINVSLGLGGKDKKGRASLNFSGRAGGSKGNQDILTDIDYYDKDTNEKVKDSLLNRLVKTRNGDRGINAGFNYSRSLGNPKDTIQKSIEFSYSFSVSSNNNELETRVKDINGKISFIDSLSNAYTSTFINQNIRGGYRYNSSKINYGIGFTLQPSILMGSYEGRTDKINQKTFNSSPSGNFSYVISKTQSVNMNYSGSSNAPRFDQLQPVPDTRNLQNVIIGNPELKTSFNHNANVSYSLFGITSGKALQIGVSASTTQNEVVSNTILIKDTLNSLKQETRYVNVNGNYNINSNYTIGLPFGNRKYMVSIGGNIGLNNSVIFTDNVKNNNKGLNFFQNIGVNMELKSLSGSAGAYYSYSENNYTIANFKPQNLESWNFNMNLVFKIRKSFNTSVDVSKNFTSGYTSGANNPLLINASVFKSFFKNNRASVNLRAYDLLNQGNNLFRAVSGNMIIENRSKQITRYFMATFSMNLENFAK